MQAIRILLTAFWALLSLGAVAADQEDGSAQQPSKTAEECEAPKWAIAIGHEQMWKLHNGCPTDEDKTQSDN